MSYKVYGENGRELSHEVHMYEIGSITKTFTTSLLAKAMSLPALKAKLDLQFQR
jgi:CubicO group peptidase (beta-lactamase class C family)